jgi:hypothetical protein
VLFWLRERESEKCRRDAVIEMICLRREETIERENTFEVVEREISERKRNCQ